MKTKNTQNYSKSVVMGFKNEFETALVNEPSVFEPLKIYCILLLSKKLNSLVSSMQLNIRKIPMEGKLRFGRDPLLLEESAVWEKSAAIGGLCTMSSDLSALILRFLRHIIVSLNTKYPRYNDSVCYQRFCCKIEFAIIKKNLIWTRLSKNNGYF